MHCSVFDAMEEQMRLGSANVGGYYPSSERVLSTVTAAHARAHFRNCGYPCQGDEDEDDEEFALIALVALDFI